jgi:hypothetical protein
MRSIIAGLMLGFTGAVFGAAALYCFNPYGTAVVPEYQATQSLIVVEWVTQGRGEQVDSSWFYDEETDTSICKIWIRLPDQILGDPDMDGIGHEVLHCLTGAFHPKDD